MIRFVALFVCLAAFGLVNSYQLSNPTFLSTKSGFQQDRYHVSNAVEIFRTTTKKSSSSTILFMNADSWNAPAAAGGAIERIEFKIYPDGRVEETVRGVKGNNCHQVTEKINEALGSVIASTPTEEMYEQSISVTETVNLSNGWDSTSTW